MEILTMRSIWFFGVDRFCFNLKSFLFLYKPIDTLKRLVSSLSINVWTGFLTFRWWTPGQAQELIYPLHLAIPRTSTRTLIIHRINHHQQEWRNTLQLRSLFFKTWPTLLLDFKLRSIKVLTTTTSTRRRGTSTKSSWAIGLPLSLIRPTHCKLMTGWSQ